MANAVTAFANQAALLRRNVWRYVDGLTDEELHWEPAPDMWGLRLKSELRTPLEEGAPEGDWWVDHEWDPDPEPFTTIGWRVAHLILGTWNWNAHLAGRPVPPEPSLPGDASSLVALWREVLDTFVDLVSGFDDADLAAKLALGDDAPARSSIVSHVTVEIACHSAEIGCLRHLYRVTR